MSNAVSIPAFTPALPCQSAHLRICLVTCFPPSRGDLNEYGFHLASALREDPGVDLVLLADETNSGEELEGFKVERCWRFDSLSTPARLLKAIRKADPDVVWFNMGFSTFARGPLAAFFSITGPAMTRLLGFYTHVTLHTIFERINLKDAGVAMPGVYRMAGRVATRFLLCANDVSVLLPSFRSELIKNYRVHNDRVHFRPHGIFSPAVPSPRLESHKEEVILAFGYWGTYKRLELLLESLDEIRKQVPDVKLLVGGLNHPSTPGYLEALQVQYADRPNIKFMGYVPETELPNLFRKASVLVLPYTSAAGTSGVVHQACEYGLPMVAAAIPEIQEVAQEYGAAIEFYSPGDGAALSDHLTRILKSDDLRQQMAQQNLAVGSSMQISQVVGGYLNLFKARTRRLRKSGFRAKHDLAPLTHLDRKIGDWLLHSRIAEPEGGVARYYLSDTKKNKPVSTEITGYCVSALVVLYEQTGEMRYWDAAVKNVRYLTKRAWDSNCSAMPFECEGDGQKYSYFFDAGIIVRGLLTAWRRCKNSDLLARATKCGDSMAQDFFDGKDFYPIITLPDKKPLPRESGRWSRSSACYQLKAALAWRELWEATGEDRFLQLYRGVLQASLDSHLHFLPGVDSDALVMDRLHAYSYFLEGLLPVLSEPLCQEAMRVGIPRAAQFAQEIAPQFLRSDVLAQILRVRIFADQAGVVPLDPETGRHEASLIREFQSADPDPRLKGGFWFGRKEGKFLPYMNPVSTVFCYQALDMWERYQKGERNFNWQKLI